MNTETKTADADKRTDHQRDIELISADTIRRLDDEQTDEHGCRFAAVARSLESTRAPNTQFEIPTTVVAYVDESGRYGLENEYYGHRPNWEDIPRTVVVSDETLVREIPDAHQATYAQILEQYKHVLGTHERRDCTHQWDSSGDRPARPLRCL